MIRMIRRICPVSALLLAVPLVAGCDRGTPQAPATPAPAAPAPVLTPAGAPAPLAERIHIIPDAVDLGEIAVGSDSARTVRIANVGATPVFLKSCKTSCGCTTARCPREETILPDEVVEFEVSMRAGSTPRTLQKKVTFVFEEGNLVLPVSATAVAYVAISPQYLGKGPDGFSPLTLAAADGEPFRITGVTPPIAGDELPTEPRTTHVVHLDEEKWIEHGSLRKVRFDVDHPRTGAVFTVVRGGTPVPGPAPAPRPGSSVVELMRQGHVDEVLGRLEAGDLTPDAVLHLAAKYGHVEVVDAVLEQGVDIDAVDSAGRTSLMMAASSTQPRIVEILLAAGAEIEVRDLVGSALSWAAGFGDRECVQLLIDAGADLEAAGQPTGFTPLIWASGFGDPESVEALLEALLEDGASLETTDQTHGATALIHAARTGGVEKIRLLVAAGADLEARDRGGMTPLLVAADASGATAEMVQALIDSGADVRAHDDDGRSALDLASDRTDPRAAAVIELLRGVLESDE